MTSFVFGFSILFLNIISFYFALATFGMKMELPTFVMTFHST